MGRHLHRCRATPARIDISNTRDHPGESTGSVSVHRGLTPPLSTSSMTLCLLSIEVAFFAFSGHCSVFVQDGPTPPSTPSDSYQDRHQQHTRSPPVGESTASVSVHRGLTPTAPSSNSGVVIEELPGPSLQIAQQKLNNHELDVY